MAKRNDRAAKNNRYLRRWNLEVNDNWRERSLNELRGMINGVTVQHNELHATRQLKYTLNLLLNLGWFN